MVQSEHTNSLMVNSSSSGIQPSKKQKRASDRSANNKRNLIFESVLSKNNRKKRVGFGDSRESTQVLTTKSTLQNNIGSKGLKSHLYTGL